MRAPDPLVKAAREGDGVALGALADWYEENAEPDLAKALRAAAHRWEDTAYHGSPTYECCWCGAKPQVLKDGSKDFAGRCPKAPTELIAAQEQKEFSERQELARMQAERDRYEELKRKYG